MICKSMFLLKKNGEPRKYRCYCRYPELIENYELAVADETQIWEVHHRREDFYSQKELIERCEYYDVPPEDLIFLTKAEHHKMDSKCKRVSEAGKGKFINRKDRSKKILCIETGEIFESMHEAERKTGISNGDISNVCNGKKGHKTAGGYHWSFV